MVTTTQLETSKAIQRRTGRTFHLATRFLPERVRHPTYVLYAFFRLADDVVDDPDPGPAAEQRATLERYRTAAKGVGASDDPVLDAFGEIRAEHGIADEEIDTFVDAMLADVDPTDFDAYADLEGYLRGSAVAVAYMMLDVMDPDDREAARPHARALAEAFQLTNFLRDVREDVTEYDRVYLPRETLGRHGVTEADVRALRFSPGFAAAVQAELRRTERLYHDGVAGIQHLPADCRFPVLLAAVLYAEHHRLIRERGYDVLADTPELGPADALPLVARTWYHWRRNPDPEAVFYRVSAVSRDPADGLGGPAPVGGQRSRVGGPFGGLLAGVRSFIVD